MDSQQQKSLARLYASRFIARPEVKAIQFAEPAGKFSAGDWFPDLKLDPVKHPGNPHLPKGFNLAHLAAHLKGERTYGHYLLDDDSNCKLFAFDLDLKETGSYVVIPDDLSDVYDEADLVDKMVVTDDVNPLELWHTRKKSALPARKWYKYQMKALAHKLASKIIELDIQCAVAYSGNKGIHVYGLTGKMPASEVRAAALLVLDMLDEFEPLKGKNFFQHKNDDPFHGFQNFSLEVFPKQDSLEGKSLGNLLRLPLGVNNKNPTDPTFFIDMTGPLTEFKPHPDPVKLLTEGNPYL